MFRQTDDIRKKRRKCFVEQGYEGIDNHNPIPVEMYS